MDLKNKNKATVRCPFCHGIVTQKKRTSLMKREIFVCNFCDLGFDLRDRNVAYETDSSLLLDTKKMKLYLRYNERIAAILNRQIEQNIISPGSSHPVEVLEVGSGYGFLSDCITRKLNIDNYYHYELNRDLQKWLKGNKKKVISTLDDIGMVDIIILSHVLEHIPDAKRFFMNLVNTKLKPAGHIILLQTDHRGFIPRYLPLLWYGWQLQQHCYHFSPRVFYQLCREMKNCTITFLEKYYLDQDINLSFKGIVKAFLNLINTVLPQQQYDAFMICITKETKK